MEPVGVLIRVADAITSNSGHSYKRFLKEG